MTDDSFSSEDDPLLGAFSKKLAKAFEAIDQLVRQAFGDNAEDESSKPKKFDLEKFLGNTTPTFATLFMQAMREDMEAVYTASAIYGDKLDRKITRGQATQLARSINRAYRDCCDRLHDLACRDVVRYAVPNGAAIHITKVNMLTGETSQESPLTRREFLSFEPIPVTPEDVIRVRKVSHDLDLPSDTDN